MTVLARRRAWHRFRRKWRSDRGRTYEPPNSGEQIPIRLWASRSPPARAVVFSKDTLLLRWIKQDIRLPRSWLTLERRGFPEGAFLKRFGEICAGARVPVIYVGDLDPLDLSSFLALRALDEDITKPQALSVLWGGISDRWLRLCRTHLREADRDLPMLPMTPLEREHWQALLDSAPEIREAVGPASAALLDSGMKLEVEGASGAGFYSDDFPALLLKSLKGWIRQLANANGP